MSILSRADILKQRLLNVGEGDLLLSLFKLAEEIGIGNEIELENAFSIPAQEYVFKSLSNEVRTFDIENFYTYMINVYYIVELYLRGYYSKEKNMEYEEFLNIVKSGKVKEILDTTKDVFVLHINRLKKIIVKSKKKIPRGNEHFKETKNLLEELDRDLSICERYPITSANLPEFYFGRYHGNVGSNLVTKLQGFLNLEKEVYSLYNELSILSKIETKYIDSIADRYTDYIGVNIPFNLFEKVINNYLFALVYSDEPENLEISKVDAELLIREIKMGTLNSDELVNQLIDRLSLDGHKAEYLREYGVHLQERIDMLKEATYFGELFLITPPDWH